MELFVKTRTLPAPSPTHSHISTIQESLSTAIENNARKDFSKEDSSSHLSFQNFIFLSVIIYKEGEFYF